MHIFTERTSRMHLGIGSTNHVYTSMSSLLHNHTFTAFLNKRFFVVQFIFLRHFLEIFYKTWVGFKFKKIPDKSRTFFFKLELSYKFQITLQYQIMLK